MTISQCAVFKAEGRFQWTPPEHVSAVRVTMIAGGTGGYGSYQVAAGLGEYGGGSGEYVISFPMSVTPGVPVDVIVGTGGAGGFCVSTAINPPGTPGGSSQFAGIKVQGGPATNSTVLRAGGGIRGGFSGNRNGSTGTPPPTPGDPGALESPIHFGGEGASPGIYANGAPSGGNPGWLTGNLPGLQASQGGGGQGASSPWGEGGRGGYGNANAAPDATNPGSGGGGGGGTIGGLGRHGAAGAPGLVMIQWVG